MHQELDACFPNVFRTYRMLLQCFPNISRIHMDATFGWLMTIILNMHSNFLELPNAVPYASVRSRTASVLIEHTECFPNMIRLLPEHINAYSENKRNGIRASVIGLWRHSMCIRHVPVRGFRGLSLSSKDGAVPVVLMSANRRYRMNWRYRRYWMDRRIAYPRNIPTNKCSPTRHKTSIINH